MKIKTSELKGVALDWAVAKSRGLSFGMVHGQVCLPNSSGDFVRVYMPSSNWGHGGPLIDIHAISMHHEEDDNLDDWWIVEAYVGYADDIHHGTGRDKESKLIAFCRALVAAELGEEVEIPDELAEAVEV